MSPFALGVFIGLGVTFMATAVGFTLLHAGLAVWDEIKGDT